MRRTHRSERLSWLVLAWTVATVASAEEPTRWLERMNQALTTRNYDGTFSHWQGGRVEMLRIIHRVQDGAVSERLVSLDGSGREFIRTGANVTCYLPDKRTVLVERRSQEQPLVGFPTINDQTASFYDISVIDPHARQSGRDAHVITVTPKDEYRYGYRLWIDDKTAMPLKTQLCDSHGHVMEQIVFASLTLASRIPDTAFKPDVSTDGFQWLRDDSGTPSSKDAHATDAFIRGALKVPPGFKMTAHAAQTMPGSTDPVDHLVYTDGLASVSVFVEEKKTTTASGGEVTMTESASVGSSSAFSTVVNGHKITAVGEVPLETVRFIANSVKGQAPDSQGPTPMLGPTPTLGPRH